MIVIYFLLFNLKRNRVKHWLGNTAQPSCEICIFKSFTCCYWWWFNSTMNCLSSLYVGLFWLGIRQCQVLQPWLWYRSQLWTQLSSSNVLPSCPIEFSPQKLMGPMETEFRSSAHFCELLGHSQLLLLSQLVALKDQALGDHFFSGCRRPFSFSSKTSLARCFQDLDGEGLIVSAQSSRS